MARGGGVVAGSKHSKENESHSSGGGGNADPKTMGIVFFICAFICLILTIAVPVALVANPPGDGCSPAASINRREQAVCIPSDYDHNWMVDTDSNGPKYAKVYKASNTSLKIVETSFTWLNYQAKLKGQYDYFGFSVPLKGWGYFDISCDGSKCKKLKMYFLTHKQFAEAIDSDGEFHEKGDYKVYKDFKDNQVNSYYYTAPGPEYYYLLFSNHKDKSVEIEYSIRMFNNVYDTSKLTEGKYDGTRVKYEDMKKGDVLIAEFPSDSSYSKAGAGVESVDINMHSDRISLGAVVAAAAIFGLLTILCGILGVVYLFVM